MSIKKKIILMTMLGSTILSGLSANAMESDFFVQLNGGYGLSMKPGESFSGGTMGKSAVFGFETGAVVNEYLRMSTSFDYIPNLSSKSTTVSGAPSGTANASIDVKSYAAMLNLYADLVDLDGFIPYITAGGGWAYNKSNQSSYTANGSTSTINGSGKNNFGWKLGLGTRYVINEMFDLDFRYQYMNLGKFSSGTSSSGSPIVAQTTGKVIVNELMFGAVYKF